jgi:RNA polymerase sigma-54 factor
MRPTLTLSPQLTMTPALRQSIRLLQLSTLELDTEIQKILESNLLLEVKGEQSNFDPFINQAEELTLKQHLGWQMGLAHFSTDEQLIAEALIDAISEDGYLSVSLQDIQESLSTPFLLTEIERVLLLIQQFDPLGVGARDLTECLKLQLADLQSTRLGVEAAKQLLKNDLHRFNKKHLNPLQKSGLKMLRSLHPKPGTTFLAKRSEYIIPDAVVVKKNGQFCVELNIDILPKLHINTHFAEMIQNKACGSATPELKAQLKIAQSFIQGLHVRQDTLSKVTQTIVNEQTAFFENGESAMKPLSLQDIALRLGLHESTISRITTNKYLLTPRGIFELKYFFSNALLNKNPPQTSKTAVLAQIKKIIAKEPSQTPFSDHRIKVLLSELGIDVARRTVTKYRKAMRIPPSAERKNIS